MVPLVEVLAHPVWAAIVITMVVALAPVAVVDILAVVDLLMAAVAVEVALLMPLKVLP